MEDLFFSLLDENDLQKYGLDNISEGKKVIISPAKLIPREYKNLRKYEEVRGKIKNIFGPTFSVVIDTPSSSTEYSLEFSTYTYGYHPRYLLDADKVQMAIKKMKDDKNLMYLYYINKLPSELVNKVNKMLRFGKCKCKYRSKRRYSKKY